jgi:hypothetical protein
MKKLDRKSRISMIAITEDAIVAVAGSFGTWYLARQISVGVGAVQ